MNISELKNEISGGKFDEMLKTLYGDVASAKERYISAADEFKSIYGDRDNFRLFSAPGRTEVGGNHTDHQHGRVLAGSVNLDVIAVVSANNSNTVRIKSAGFPEDVIDITNLNPDKSEYGRASALIRGVLGEFIKRGYKIGGFDAYTTSNVMKGSGLSSSAAFEVLVGTVVNGLYNGETVSSVEIAKIAQISEREYFGKPCGLLDQMASSQGGFTYVDFNNPSEPVIEKIEFDINKQGYVLCVVDTGGDHTNLTGDYADITVECKKISNYFGKDFLRQCNPDEFYENIGEIRKKCGDRAVLRAFHFFNEDARVDDEKKALLQDDFEKFLDYVNESGESSYKYLQNVYSNSDVQNQGLPLALALTEKFLKGEGACRVHGGGFAGTIQCYIPSDKIVAYKNMIEAVFGENSCCVLNIRPYGGCEIK